MTSCFLCDCSSEVGSNYSVTYAQGKSEDHYMKYMPIMVGSSGYGVDRLGHVVDCGTDQQHKDNNKQNYVSYRVKKIEFRAYVSDDEDTLLSGVFIPDYIIIFKVPFRETIFDYYFTIMKNFILYSEPESVLKYGVYSRPFGVYGDFNVYKQKRPDRYDLIVDKPFIVGPNDYVGVLYFFSYHVRVDASARVWFDVV